MLRLASLIIFHHNTPQVVRRLHRRRHAHCKFDTAYRFLFRDKAAKGLDDYSAAGRHAEESTGDDPCASGTRRTAAHGGDMNNPALTRRPRFATPPPYRSKRLPHAHSRNETRIGTKSESARPRTGGGEGGIRTHVPGLPDHLISSQRRYGHFGTSPDSCAILPAMCSIANLPSCCFGYRQ